MDEIDKILKNEAWETYEIYTDCSIVYIKRELGIKISDFDFVLLRVCLILKYILGMEESMSKLLENVSSDKVRSAFLDVINKQNVYKTFFEQIHLKKCTIHNHKNFTIYTC